VDIRLDSCDRLRGCAVSLDTYDLIMGHRWIIGDEALLDGCERHADAKQIPLADGLCVLVERCSSLLLARERLKGANFNREDAKFVRHSIAKAQLALGDVYLIAKQQYHWSSVQRCQRLSGAIVSPWAWELVGHHAQGVDFQLHPTREHESRESLSARHSQVSELARVLWLWLERTRLKQGFSSVRVYAHDAGSKCPEHRPLRNLLVNARTFGELGLRSRWRLRDPRERLLRSLPLLLWSALDTEDGVLMRSCFDVIAGAANPTVSVYEKLWRKLGGAVLQA
jgi:hypothetical protein